jgi:CRISPR/Cas system-associated exonuclease Cas4 (RecB family)
VDLKILVDLAPLLSWKIWLFFGKACFFESQGRKRKKLSQLQVLHRKVLLMTKGVIVTVMMINYVLDVTFILVLIDQNLVHLFFQILNVINNM